MWGCTPHRRLRLHIPSALAIHGAHATLIRKQHKSRRPAAPFLLPQTLASSLAAAVDSGLTKSVGVSNYSEAEVRETHRVLAERGIPLAVNQAGSGAVVLGVWL